jgi:hypothetical protein
LILEPLLHPPSCSPDNKLLETKARNQRGKWGETARYQRQRWRYLQVCLIFKIVSMGLLYISSVELLFPRVFNFSFPKGVSFFLSGSIKYSFPALISSEVHWTMLLFKFLFSHQNLPGVYFRVCLAAQNWSINKVGFTREREGWKKERRIVDEC